MNHENLDLSKDDDLKKACEAVRENNPKWRAKVVGFLKDVQEADEETAPVQNSSGVCGARRMSFYG